MNTRQLLKRIVLIGFMGAGKTTVGEEVAHRLGFTFFDLDREIVARSCFESVREIFEVCGEAFFRKMEAEVFSELLRHEGVVVATGGGVVSNDLATRELESSAQRGEIVYLKAHFDTLVKRVGGDHGRPLFQDIDTAKTLFDSREEKYSRYASSVVQVDNQSLEIIVEKVVAAYKANVIL